MQIGIRQTGIKNFQCSENDKRKCDKRLTQTESVHINVVITCENEKRENHVLASTKSLFQLNSRTHLSFPIFMQHRAIIPAHEAVCCCRASFMVD